MEDVKKCTKCGRELPLDQFYKRKYRGSIVGRQAKCIDCYRSYCANWSRENPQKCREKTRRFRKNNPQKCRMIESRWRKKRMANDVCYKLKISIRRRMSNVLGTNMKSGHTIELLGCTAEELRNHLERQFRPGMTWDNYGRKGWHIDHIIPLTYFDQSDPEQQKRAWHYTNLQPLWAVDNLKKHNKIEERQLILL